MKFYRVNEITGKPMGIIGFLLRWRKASKARKLDEGLLEREEYERKKRARLQQTQYETALQWALQKETLQLLNGRVTSFTFDLMPEMYQYFQAILNSPEFSQFEFKEIGKFQYEVTLKVGGDIFEI